MLGGMVFGDVVPQVFGAGVPKNAYMFVRDWIDDPKVAHLHGAGPLAFDGV
jgi:hypothetical protein